MRTPRQKARDLVALAADEATPEKERLNAALRVVKLIHKYDLLSSPLDMLDGSNNEMVQAGKTILETLTNPTFMGSVKKVASKVSKRRRR